MNHRSPSLQDLPRAQLLTERAFATLERFLHIESVSGTVLLVAAAIALVWANLPDNHSYHDLWHTPLTLGVGSYQFVQPLHFWINDALMTIFFLVVGLEIRREIHEGALSDLRQAALPIAAALGGVVAPACIYFALNHQPPGRDGWAVPTATDIAFAVGVLALLGRGIPGNVRVFLLALAIIDDIVAVLIIALFYSDGLNYFGFVIAGAGVALVFCLQRMGIGTANAYVIPGAIVWIGLLKTGAHPTLAGVLLGLMTPVTSTPMRERPTKIVSRIAGELDSDATRASPDAHRLGRPIKELRVAQREILPPVVRIQMALHPWVAYGIMPLFALANAGVSLGGVDVSSAELLWITTGIALALCAGKPLGIVAVTWLAVRLGLCRLPEGVTWSWIVLVGLLAGIGFTMSIFIAMLAFGDEGHIDAAKFGVLVGSFCAGMLGLAWGSLLIKRKRTQSRNCSPASR